MKYVLLLAAVGIIYYFLTKNAPVAPVTQAVTGQDAAALSNGPRNPASPPASAPATTNLKRPLDRTRSVLDQVKSRNGNGEF